MIWVFGGRWRFLTGVLHPDDESDMVAGLCFTHILNFSSLSWFWRCKEHPCPLSPHLGLWRMLEVPDLGLVSWSWFGYGHWSLIYPWSKFLLSILFWSCKEHPCPLSPDLGLWRMLGVPDWGLASWSWFGYSHWSLTHPWSKLWLSILILKGKRTSMSFESWFWALKYAGGSWLGFGIWTLIWIWSLVFDTRIFWLLDLYLYFEEAKNIHVL